MRIVFLVLFGFRIVLVMCYITIPLIVKLRQLWIFTDSTQDNDMVCSLLSGKTRKERVTRKQELPIPNRKKFDLE